MLIVLNVHIGYLEIIVCRNGKSSRHVEETRVRVKKSTDGCLRSTVNVYKKHACDRLIFMSLDDD